MVDRAEVLALKIDEALSLLNDRLRDVRAENEKLESFSESVESLRAGRKEVEGELRLLESQRARLSETEQQLISVEKSMELLGGKVALLADSEDMAEDIDRKVVELNEMREEFDGYLRRINGEKEVLSAALEKIENSQNDAGELSARSTDLLTKIERADLRQKDIQENLRSLEKRFTDMRGMESQIHNVEARFEQMDGLLMDLEKKQNQIRTMSKRMEDIRHTGDDTKTELESLLGEADEKMDRLTAFYELLDKTMDSRLDTHNETPKPVGKKKRSTSGLPDWKRDGILSLHLNHKWEADLIAERMKIEPSTVRAVIASHEGI